MRRRSTFKLFSFSFRDFSRPDLPSGEGQPSFDPNLGLSALGLYIKLQFVAAER